MPIESPHSAFHVGEKSVQTRMGVREVSERATKNIRPYLTDQAKKFLSELPLLFIGSRDKDGCVWATTLCGPQGFIQAPDESHLVISASQPPTDPLQLREGDRVGAVGVMLHNRRRNRLNGVVEECQPGRLVLRVLESFGNCPKYIQVRDVRVDEERLRDPKGVSLERGGSILGKEELDLIARSDTLFLATGFFGVEEGADGMDGCDCNHRGGAPGFVKASEDGTLLIPDFVGNGLFQSLGNMVQDPRAGIQFLDFATGDSLQLSGKTSILWDERGLPGAQRTLKFETHAWVHTSKVVPITTIGAVEASPYNPLPPGAGNALVGLKIMSKHQETPMITTYSFEVPKSGDDKSFCQAGQFASFDFPNIKPGEVLNRTWTISSPPVPHIKETGRFTISVKKDGVVSNWMLENLSVLSEVVFRGVDGDFTLDKAADCISPAGVMLIAGGIGVTPMRAMLWECIKRQIPCCLLYVVREVEEAAFLDEFKKAASEHKFVEFWLTVTGKGEAPEGHSNVLTGRPEASQILQVCPNIRDREIFQCGPDAMMSSILKSLEGLGISSAKVHQEAFTF